MNEYKKLIEHITARINNINEKINENELKKSEFFALKENLEIIVKQISELKLLEINTMQMYDSLIPFLGDIEANELMNQFNEIVSMAPYLINEKINSPIKDEMLKDLEQIKEIISSIKIKIEEYKYEISKQELEEKQELEKYLEILDENGFCKLLSNEDRNKFYEFLKTSGMDLTDVLSIIKDYIKYGLKQKKQEEILTSNSSIDTVNNNAEVILKELEQQTKEDIEEVIIPSTINNIPIMNEDEQKIYNHILELVEKYQPTIDPITYNLYKNTYTNQDILHIYMQRAEFLNVNGIEWEKAIPCIKEKLIPMIDSEDRELIFQIFNCIISLNKNQLKQEKEIKKENSEHKENLKKFNEKFKIVAQEVAKIKSESGIITNIIDEKLKGQDKDNIISLLKIAQTEIKENINPTIFESFGISYEQARNYILFDNIIAGLEYIREFIEIGISIDDFEEIKTELEKIETNIKEYKNNYKIILNEIKNKQLEQQRQEELIKSLQLEASTKTDLANRKQYESGKNIIVFYRKDDMSKFLIEEDLENIDNPVNSYVYIEKILKTINDIEYWHWREKRYYNFREDIDASATNKKPYIFLSNYSGKNLEFSRLKAPIQKKGEDNNTRLSCLKIDLCEENRIKLNLSSRTIILIIGAMNISNHNSNSEYSYFRTQLEKNSDEIQKIINLFENPNTPESILIKLLNDSSDLYNILRIKPKGHM